MKPKLKSMTTKAFGFFVRKLKRWGNKPEEIHQLPEMVERKIFKIFNFSDYKKRIEFDTSDIHSNISFDKEHEFSLRDIILMNRGKNRKIIFEMKTDKDAFKSMETLGISRTARSEDSIIEDRFEIVEISFQ